MHLSCGLDRGHTSFEDRVGFGGELLEGRLHARARMRAWPPSSAHAEAISAAIESRIIAAQHSAHVV
ncbi:hypothetical protein DB32_000001 [Sandaracinus amylolyticus]|uniref:Uncharacterized protein n=1 Tax=Sandaracinus amylolyticus TaxID=927083 RepID=A0A0F6YFR8_9BACT|nr:hypothetical protein DB32_000001 [Sandaracinus amylolyticus]